MTDTPEAPAPPPAAAPAPAGPGAPNIIRIPLLVSGILNGLAALGWLSTCILFFVAIPLAVLAVFEIIYFVKLGQPDYAQHKPKTKLISILEMCSIVFLNLGALICGIIIFINLDKAIPDEPASEG